MSTFTTPIQYHTGDPSQYENKDTQIGKGELELPRTRTTRHECLHRKLPNEVYKKATRTNKWVQRDHRM